MTGAVVWSGEGGGMWRLIEPSGPMTPTSPMRSRLMRSPATTDVQSLHDRRAEARSPADLCVPFLHNALSPFNRAWVCGTHAHVVSATHPSRRSCGHGVVQQRYTQNSERGCIEVTILYRMLANCVCNKPTVLSGMEGGGASG